MLSVYRTSSACRTMARRAMLSPRRLMRRAASSGDMLPAARRLRHAEFASTLCALRRASRRLPRCLRQREPLCRYAFCQHALLLFCLLPSAAAFRDVCRIADAADACHVATSRLRLRRCRLLPIFQILARRRLPDCADCRCLFSLLMRRGFADGGCCRFACHQPLAAAGFR
jgi:hypothetical protein